MGERGIAVRRLVAGLAALLAAVYVAVPAPAAALAFPPYFVSNLNLECWRAGTYVPTPLDLTLKHIHPALADLPPVTVHLDAREQVCGPISINYQTPPLPALDFIRYANVSCYWFTTDGGIGTRELVLKYLNPLFENAPPVSVRMTEPGRLCLPVSNDIYGPPSGVKALVSRISLLCYKATAVMPVNSAGVTMNYMGIEQLNPTLASQIRPAGVGFGTRRHLCVPVQIAGDNIPPDVLETARYVSLVTHDASAVPNGEAAYLTLRHNNPRLVRRPSEPATLTTPTLLAVPVAIDNQLPPG
ncbi:hypothetical protein Skr01_38690 [Sphaerisporangium krabiense]|uniref:Uncharacterized protein n=1 Tax=Sphaerisporangium krabiense TaxID=763782 RepID=A0A7W8Z904_9ACTN|nr:hypothetical protein [Sphaerisporangium krabiense]MBB5629686.1 hypothetical protein [Sphaerisporangium krabiense]GII63784.1 hypothetical protein Skr01_38690 [Sphaerisporangium krabiense]